MIKPQNESRDPQKRDLGTFLGHLSFWVNGMESPLIFLYKKEKKEKLNIKYMIELFHSLIEIN